MWGRLVAQAAVASELVACLDLIVPNIGSQTKNQCQRAELFDCCLSRPDETR
jgi:hypothetical protein